MGFLNDVRARFTRRKEERLQREVMSRPARLEAFKKERDLYRARREESKLRQEVRKEKYAKIITAAEKIGSYGSSITKKGKRIMKNNSSLYGSNNMVVNTPDKDTLFKVNK